MARSSIDKPSSSRSRVALSSIKRGRAARERRAPRGAVDGRSGASRGAVPAEPSAQPSETPSQRRSSAAAPHAVRAARASRHHGAIRLTAPGDSAAWHAPARPRAACAVHPRHARQRASARGRAGGVRCRRLGRRAGRCVHGLRRTADGLHAGMACRCQAPLVSCAALLARARHATATAPAVTAQPHVAVAARLRLLHVPGCQAQRAAPASRPARAACSGPSPAATLAQARRLRPDAARPAACRPLSARLCNQKHPLTCVPACANAPLCLPHGPVALSTPPAPRVGWRHAAPAARYVCPAFPLRCRHTRRPQSPSGLPPPHLSLSASARL